MMCVGPRVPSGPPGVASPTSSWERGQEVLDAAVGELIYLDMMRCEGILNLSFFKLFSFPDIADSYGLRDNRLHLLPP